MSAPSGFRPRARNSDLLVEEVGDETVVYDLERQTAHRLNPAAHYIWTQCDGRTTVSDIARRLPATTGLPADEKVVWLGLHRLQALHLLDGTEFPRQPRISRRTVLQSIGVGGAALLPAVSSIVAPTPAMAASIRLMDANEPCFWDGTTRWAFRNASPQISVFGVRSASLHPTT